MKVLIVDDEKQLCDALAAIFKKNRIDVDCVYNGEDGLDYALTGLYDLVILDVMLPILSGIEVLSALRRKGLATPVLMLSAKSETSDKIEGLDVGADDYLTKPFDTGELLARVRALTRRGEVYEGDELLRGNVTLDRDSHVLRVGGESMSLGVKEYAVMEMLMRNTGVIPKERFIEKIWGYDSEAEYNTIEVYVSFLRKKLNALGANVSIRSLRGVGYQLETRA